MSGPGCFNCGSDKHYARNCPYPAGKGASKGKGNTSFVGGGLP